MSGGCDPRALEIARAIHEAERPLATILFGSRARGDYDDRRSDIDVMLALPEKPDFSHQESVTDWAEGIAESVYGRSVPVQIVWFSQQDFQQNRRYLNHLVTNALRDGVAMPRDPQDSTYMHDENEASEYDWTDYETRARHAAVHLRVFESLVEDDEDDLVVGQHAHSALEHALKALIAAHGAAYPRTHELGQLLGTVRRLNPEFEALSIGIDPAIYSEYAGFSGYSDARKNPRLAEQDDYRERTASDVRCILRRAAEVKAATGNAL